MDGDDIRMRERGNGARLPLKASEAIAVGGQPRRHRLDCNIALEPRIARTIDLAHTARTDERHELVWTESGAFRDRHLRPSLVAYMRATPD